METRKFIKITVFLTLIIFSLSFHHCQVPPREDTTPPLCTIIYPVSGQAISGTINISVGASDKGGLSHVNLYIDGNLATRMTESPFEYLWDTSPIADNQNHSISAASFDKAGNSTISPAAIVRVVQGAIADTLPPVATIIYPVNGSIVSDTVKVIPEIFDNSEIIRVDYYINGIIRQSFTEAPFEYDWIVSNLIDESSHSIFLRAFDENQNNSYSNVVTVTVRSDIVNDNIPPTVGINYPITGLTVSGNVPVFATATDNVAIDRLELYVDGQLYDTKSTQPWEFSWDVSGLINGSTHSIFIIAYDTNQNQTISSVVTVTISSANISDLIAPTNALIFPSSCTFLRRNNINFIAEAYDNIGISRVEFYINGLLVGTDAITPYEYLLDLSSLNSEEDYSIYAKVFDGAGNETQTKLQSITIAPQDKTPPNSNIRYPNSGAVINKNITISAQAEDNIGVSYVEFYIDGYLVGIDTNEPYTFEWNTDGYENNSTHKIETKAYDAWGNVGHSIVRNVIVKKSKQTIPKLLISPKSGTEFSDGDIVTVSAISPKNIEVDKVEFYVDGILKSTDMTPPYRYSWNTSGCGMTEPYSIYIKWYDKNGTNNSEIINITIKSKNILPNTN